MELEKVGFGNIHKNALISACGNLKETLNMDFVERKSFQKKINSPRPRLFINAETNSVIILTEPREIDCIEKIVVEVTCLSKAFKEVNDTVDTLKELLTSKIGIAEETIHDGNCDEICDKNFIESLSETSRSALVKKVNVDILDTLTPVEVRTRLKELTNFPFKVFDFHYLERVIDNPQALVSSGLLKENFSPICKKCGMSMDPIALFDSKENLSLTLEKGTLICRMCGKKLNLENATIRCYFGFTDVGREYAKGLWLEAYMRAILEELGILGDGIKVCAVHGKDELDLIFSDYGNLYVCECRDRVVGRNDIYVLGMKVNRIEEDAEVVVNKVLVVSTQPISKDVISPEKEDVETEYIGISGDVKTIKKTVIGITRKARQKYKRQMRKELSRLLLECLPLTQEEMYKRLSEEYFPF